jgi:hypothetical protein
VAAAVATQDPVIMRSVAAQLRTEGHQAAAITLDGAAVLLEQAAVVEAKAEEIMTNGGEVAPPPPPPPPIPPPAPPPLPTLTTPSSKVGQLAKAVSDHLNALIRMKGSVAKAKGSEDRTLIRNFQIAAGAYVDGLYGPGTAKAIAKYWGDVPILAGL